MMPYMFRRVGTTGTATSANKLSTETSQEGKDFIRDLKDEYLLKYGFLTPAMYEEIIEKAEKWMLTNSGRLKPNHLRDMMSDYNDLQIKKNALEKKMELKVWSGTKDVVDDFERSAEYYTLDPYKLAVLKRDFYEGLLDGAEGTAGLYDAIDKFEEAYVMAGSEDMAWLSGDMVKLQGLANEYEAEKIKYGDIVRAFENPIGGGDVELSNYSVIFSQDKTGKTTKVEFVPASQLPSNAAPTNALFVLDVDKGKIRMIDRKGERAGLRLYLTDIMAEEDEIDRMIPFNNFSTAMWMPGKEAGTEMRTKIKKGDLIMEGEEGEEEQEEVEVGKTPGEYQFSAKDMESWGPDGMRHKVLHDLKPKSFTRDTRNILYYVDPMSRRLRPVLDNSMFEELGGKESDVYQMRKEEEKNVLPTLVGSVISSTTEGELYSPLEGKSGVKPYFAPPKKTEAAKYFSPEGQAAGFGMSYTPPQAIAPTRIKRPVGKPPTGPVAPAEGRAPSPLKMFLGLIKKPSYWLPW